MQRPASIDDQVRRCSEYVAERGGKVASELVFSDAAKSGASLVRGGFEQLMKLVRQRPRGVDAIVVEDMSRVTRDLADASHLFRELRYLDIPTIRRIFDEYLKGNSYAAIAQVLNRESVPPPRAKSRHRRKGWVASTIRAMLLNESYIGVWTFKRKQWQKVPGTNDRRSRARRSEQIIRREDPERRIIDVAVWDAVRTRSVAVRARYTGRRAPGSAPVRVTNYPLSGLLHCGCCGAPMVITAGTSFYKCGDHKKRRTCSNSLGVKEELARTRIFSALQEKFSNPEALDF